MIIYLHGFNSTGDSAKGQTLKKSLDSDISFLTPTYSYEPNTAINSLRVNIEQNLLNLSTNEPKMIIGSSLGGFYAQYLARQFTGFKVVLINPALGPINTLQTHLGENENFYTGEKYQTCAKINLFEGGNHQFQHLEESIPLINDFYYA